MPVIVTAAGKDGRSNKEKNANYIATFFDLEKCVGEGMRDSLMP
jgi:hypothetical protein